MYRAAESLDVWETPYEDLGEGDFLDALQERDLCDIDFADTVFFEIVDPRPEAKYQVRTHEARKRTLVQVRRHEFVELEGDAMRLRVGGMQTNIDLARWCGPGHFAELMQGLVGYDVSAANVTVVLTPLIDGHRCAVLQPPSALCDDVAVVSDGEMAAMEEDALGILFAMDEMDDVPDVAPGAVVPLAAAGAFAPDVVPGAAVLAADGALAVARGPSFQVEGNALVSGHCMPLVESLVHGRRFAGGDCGLKRSSITGWSQTAQDELLDLGIVSCGFDVSAGEDTLAIRLETLNIRGQLYLRNPTMLCSRALPSSHRKFEKFGKLELVRTRFDILFFKMFFTNNACNDPICTKHMCLMNSALPLTPCTYNNNM